MPIRFYFSFNSNFIKIQEFCQVKYDQPDTFSRVVYVCKMIQYYCNTFTNFLFLLATQAYDELVDIIHHPQFKSEDVITNIQCFRKYQQRLPLLPIKSRYIHISDKKIPSTSKNTKEVYYLSITDIIWQVFNNPLLFNQMYFSSGQKVKRNRKL